MSKKIEFVAPDEIVERFDDWVKKHGFHSRSEALRELMRKTIFGE